MSYEDIDFKDKNIPSEKINFSKQAIKKDSNGRMFLSVFALLTIFLLGMILPKSAKATSEGEYQNYFYVNVINNVLSIVKSSNTDEQYANSENNMKIAALSYLGVDILNPISIITKEVAYLDKNEFTTDEENATDKGNSLKTFILNPFKLGDKQVSKSEDKVEAPNVIADLYNPKLKQTLNNAKPRVLIYHSHTTESYKASDKDTSKSAFNSDETKNVCAVGDVIKEELEKNYGIAVIHDKTVHNVGDYNAAYKKSGVTLDKYLKAYGGFDLVIDLHRDGVADKRRLTTKINGESVAKIMFVVAQGNPRYPKQKKLVNSMIGISNKLYPNLLNDLEITVVNRGIAFYNQNRSDNAVLIEVGTYTNNISEVKNTGKYLSRIFAEQLNVKK